jgi:hypothetical protein
MKNGRPPRNIGHPPPPWGRPADQAGPRLDVRPFSHVGNRATHSQFHGWRPEAREHYHVLKEGDRHRCRARHHGKRQLHESGLREEHRESAQRSGRALAAQYTQNRQAHAQHSQPYVGRGVRQ